VVVDHPRAWAEVALATSAIVLVASAELTLRRRRLELGVIERWGAIRSAIGTLMVAAALVAVLGHMRAEGVARLALAAGRNVVAAWRLTRTRAGRADCASSGRAGDRRRPGAALVGLRPRKAR